MDSSFLNKIENIKEIYEELKVQFDLYTSLDGVLKRTAFFASQKKAEELIEYAIKLNRLLLREKKIFPMSYKDSFLKLEKIGFEKNLCEKFSDFAFFRNRLAHEYLEITEDETVEEIESLIKLFPKYLKKILVFV